MIRSELQENISGDVRRKLVHVLDSIYSELEDLVEKLADESFFEESRSDESSHKGFVF